MKQEIYYENLPTINRNVLVVEPTEVFLEWAKNSPDDDMQLTLKDRKFFRVHYCSSVIDLAKGPIEQEYI